MKQLIPQVERLEPRALLSDATSAGSEFRVNSYTTDFQGVPAVACDAAGGSVITWMSHGQDGSDHGVFARRYDAAGAQLGGEFQVNTYTTSDQGPPVVASDPAGDFLIAWSSSGQDGSGSGVYAQRYAVAPSSFSRTTISARQTAPDRADSSSIDALYSYADEWVVAAV